MKTHLEIPINELFMNNLIEKFRAYNAHNLNKFLKKIKYYNPLNYKVKDYRLKETFNQDFLQVYDENGKISWDAIRLFIPPGIEKAIKSECKEFNDNEIRLCCLLIFDVPTKSILNILTYNKKSIYSTTYTIKKKAKVKKIPEIFRNIILNMISIDN